MLQAFIDKARKTHGTEYDYSRVAYVKSKDKVDIVCRTHGVFSQTPAKHIQGRGCPACGKKSAEDSRRGSKQLFIEKARKVHDNAYQYDKVKYKLSGVKVTITCPDHGDFEQTPGNHLNMKQGCPTCAHQKRAPQTFTQEQFLERAIEVHGGKFDYSEASYSGMYEYITIRCPTHGTFTQTPNRHFSGTGCPTCGHEAGNQSKKLTQSDFVTKSTEIHASRYDYSKAIYKDMGTPVEVICKKHGSFFPTPGNHIHQATGCPKCTHQVSKPEQEIFEWVKTRAPDAVQSDKTILGNRELDIYVPSLNLAIEFNGLYYHSELRKPGEYHQDKTKRCAEKGVRLIHVFEDMWITKKNHVLGILAMALGKPFHIFHARKLILDTAVSAKEANTFLSENHIYTKRGARIKYGLREPMTNRLVSVMTFGSPPAQLASKYQWELVRFANLNGCTVVGGADKLWKHFKATLTSGDKVLCFSDQSLFAGTGIYKRLGFTETSEMTPPCRWYIGDNYERIHRSNFTFPRMRARGIAVDKTKNQHDNAMSQSHIKFSIKDCGSARHLYTHP